MYRNILFCFDIITIRTDCASVGYAALRYSAFIGMLFERCGSGLNDILADDTILCIYARLLAVRGDSLYPFSTDMTKRRNCFRVGIAAILTFVTPHSIVCTSGLCYCNLVRMTKTGNCFTALRATRITNFLCTTILSGIIGLTVCMPRCRSFRCDILSTDITVS